jgi:hypothetical protein
MNKNSSLLSEKKKIINPVTGIFLKILPFTPALALAVLFYLNTRKKGVPPQKTTPIVELDCPEKKKFSLWKYLRQFCCIF